MHADYIIIGAGSAGCAIAYRLAQAGKTVIVIEHGGTDAGPFIQMPGALSYPMGMSRYNWGFETAPEPHLGGRRMATPRGKVLGGSSSINGMVYVRGHARDFDTWGRDGRRWMGPMPMCCPIINAWKTGTMAATAAMRRGVVTMARCTFRAGHVITRLSPPLSRRASRRVTPHTDDYNGAQQEGFGPFDATIHKGERWSAYKAYLKPAPRHGQGHHCAGFGAKGCD